MRNATSARELVRSENQVVRWSDRFFRLYKGFQVIEIIRLNEQLIRVTGFHRLHVADSAAFEIVVQIPGKAAEESFNRLLNAKVFELEFADDQSDPERHLVRMTDHSIHTAGLETKPLYRHQIRLEALPEADFDEDLTRDLAETLQQFYTLLNQLDAAGLVSRADVERRARE